MAAALHPAPDPGTPQPGGGAAESGSLGRVQQEVERALATRLVADEPTALISHVALILVLASLLWADAPRGLLGAWVGAVIVAVVLRRVMLRRLARPGVPADVVPRAVRLCVAAVALAWGVGAAALFPAVPIGQGALILVTLAGLVGGATATLVADPPSFRAFLLFMLGPLPAGILAGGTGRTQWSMVLLVVLFGAMMVVVHSRAHKSLLEYLVTSARLGIEEEATEGKRAQLDALLVSAPVAIVIVDRDGLVRRVNPRFTQLFGYGPDASGRALNDLIVPASERPKAQRFDLRLRRGETVVAEMERRRKDGSVVPVRASAALVQGDAEGSVFVMYEDISDRRRADDALTQLASIVQTSEDAIVGEDLAGTVTSWNSGAERMFGYGFAEMRGKPAAVLLPPERRAELRAILDRIGKGERVQHFETVRLRKDGTQIPVSLSLSVAREGAGRIAGFSWIARDVSAQAAVRVAMEDARAAAERSARARSQFLANMSHEIRTPMNAVLGLTELLLDSELTGEQRRSLAMVQSSGETLLALLNDVLDFSKIDAEHLELEDIPYDLRHVIESTASLLAVRARAKKIELIADVAADVPQTVRGDPTRLRQVLTNLIGNALKFTEHGEVVVAAAPTGERDGRTLVALTVRDTGIGIPESHLGAIFDEFTQADASMTRRYGGTGLGLTIARRLVAAMGGELSVTSVVGRGSEFAFTIPYALAPTPEAGPAPATVLADRRVLVVDDNATNRRILREMLSSAAVIVTEAAGVTEGLEALRRAREAGTPVDLVLLDAQMPERDGFDFAAAAREDPALPNLRLLMLTSAGQRGDAQRCRELGIGGYLTKPIPRADLLQAVAAVLRNEPLARRSQMITRHTIAEARRQLRVLLAEDNAINQEVAATMLRKRGHHVDVVNDGREAVAAVSRHVYDVVLMDVQMPVLDGFAATAEIRALPGGDQLPIIALTAHALSGERERCLAHGMSGYLAKPFHPDALFATVESALRDDGSVLAPVAPAATPAPAGDAPVDVARFRREMQEAGAEDAVDTILASFVVSIAERLTALNAAEASGEAAEVQRAAHAYKSSAGAVRATRLAELLEIVEVAARDGDVSGARQGLAGVRDESQRVLEYLDVSRAGAAPRE